MAIRHPLVHDRDSVTRLHQAYADKIESFFTGLQRCPGDPCQVRIRTFGSTRTFIAKGHPWLNRVTLTGDETIEQLNDITAWFAEHGERCHIEWNPGNCYKPDTWNDSLGRRLIEMGFRPRGFRCVWVAETADLPPREHAVTLRHFGADEIEEFLAVLAELEQQDDEQKAQARLKIIYGEGDSRWRHYVGYIDGTPCCNATTFAAAPFAYLEWAHTLESFRGRGCHSAMIQRRLADAHADGCGFAVAVTDVGNQSSFNLQREGFRLAYNYVMLIKNPSPS